MPSVTTLTDSARSRDPQLALLLIAAVFAVYAPALGGGLVWDDAAHVTIGALQGWDGLARIWFEPGVTQQYYPVLHSAFWLEHRLWGDAVVGYHLATAAQHAIAACLIVLLCQRLAVGGAWVVGFVFALHPVNVESVAWISEQKNTLSLVFALSSSLLWLRFDASRAPRHWAAAFVLFMLALGSKTVTATLPCVLLVVVWWQRGRIEWRRDVLPLLPCLALGIAAGLSTAWVERHVIGAAGAEFALSPLQRVLLSGRAVWHYLATFARPTELAFNYPRWTIESSDALAYVYPAAIVAITAVLWRLRRTSRAPLAAWLAFVGMLVPVLGFLDVYPFRYAFVADHFQYHASIPLAMLAGAGIARVRERVAAWQEAAEHPATRRVSARRMFDGCMTTLLVVFAAQTWRHAGNYRDAETLYRATIAANPASWMAHHNLGRLVSRKPGGLEEAIAHFRAAIELKPDHARAHYSLGVALQRVGRGTQAVPHFEAAIRLEPENPLLVGNAHYIAGDILRRDPARLDAAIAHLREAARRKPMVAEVHQTLGEALALAGHVSEARNEHELALRLQSDDRRPPRGWDATRNPANAVPR